MRIYIFNLDNMTIATCSEDKLRDMCEYVYKNFEEWEQVNISEIDSDRINSFVCDYENDDLLLSYYITPFNDYENVGLCLCGLGCPPDITFEENPIMY